VKCPAADPDAIGASQRVVQQPVAILAVVTNAHVVGAVVEDGVDLPGADELLQFDHMRLLAGSRRRSHPG
jgi:hypothetical protein